MDIQIPADLTTVDDAALAELLADLITEFDAMHDAGSTDLGALTEIADAVESIRGEQASRAEAAAAAAEAIAALADRVRPAEVSPEDDAADEGDDAEATAAPAAPAEEPALVTASGQRRPAAPSARAIRRHAPQSTPTRTAEPTVAITAAADIPGVPTGARLDLPAVARAMHDKARNLSNGSPRVPIARFSLPYSDDRKIGADLGANLATLDRVRSPQALTAAGWCAPSQNLYELFGIEGGDGLLDLPSVQITRGGLNVPGFLDISEAADALWTWTEEDQDDPEASKPCLRIPCPEFTDYRLVAEGLCLTNGNLTDRAFPELTTRFIELTINAHLHRMSAAMINAISATAPGVSMTTNGATASAEILNAIDLQVADYRSKYLMPVNSVLEVIFPLWVKEILRADFAYRDAAGYSNVTDAMIDDHFAARHVRAQFLHDYTPISGLLPKTAWPNSINFLIYPTGGYVMGDGGTIDLGVVRDSVLNATNDYTAAWTEQMYLVAQLGPAAREVNVETIVGGYTGCCPPAVVA